MDQATPSSLSAPPVFATAEEALHYGMALQQKGDVDSAEEIYRRVLEIVPQHPDALHLLGMALYQLGDIEGAVNMIGQAVERLPEHAPFRNNLGNALVAAERFDEAEQQYRRAFELDGHRVDALNNFAVLCRVQDRPEEAEQAYLRALALAPNFLDARNNLANLYVSLGRIEEALAESAKVLAVQPQQPRVLSMLGLIYSYMGRVTEAAGIYRKWLDVDPTSPWPAHLLAACTGENVPERASNAYISDVFDGFAESFDARLSKLLYRAPELVGRAVAERVGTPLGTLRVLDAGCGTGLCGVQLRPYANHLEGVDLSSGMLLKARERKTYDALHHDELVAHLVAHAGEFDIIASADTLCYFGSLFSALQGAWSALRDAGWLVFTVEASPEDDVNEYRLNPHGRYSHRADHVRRCLADCGFEQVAVEKVVLRMEAGRPVDGWLVAARRHDGIDSSVRTADSDTPARGLLARDTHG